MSLSCAKNLHFPRPWGQPVAAKNRDQRQPHAGDELRELAETFRQTVARLSALVKDLEAARDQAMEAEVEKKRFYREVIRSVTLGKFELVERDEVPSDGTLLCELPVRSSAEYAAARAAIRDEAEALGLSDERTDDLILASGEIITNALKHAQDGCLQLYRTEGSLRVRVADRGTGIGSQNLPAALLMPGFSTKVSLGMGYKMLLQLCDHVWLSTGPEGTVVQIEQRLRPASIEEQFAPGLLDRML